MTSAEIQSVKEDHFSVQGWLKEIALHLAKLEEQAEAQKILTAILPEATARAAEERAELALHQQPQSTAPAPKKRK